MLQLLLVDDHPHLVEELAETVDWPSIGIQAVHRAFSASEALSVMKAQSIDIVVTDIRMPGMSGLDLIREIRRTWRKTKCLLLTGHAEFEYAREAVAVQADSYLLKPVTADEITDAVKLAIGSLRREWEEITSSQRALHAFRENLPLLRNQLLNRLLENARMDGRTCAEQLAMYDIPLLPGAPCAMLLIRIDDSFPDYRDRAVFQYAIGNIIEELAQGVHRVWQGKEASDYQVILLQPAGQLPEEAGEDADREKERIGHLASQVQHNAKLYLKRELSLFFSTGIPFPSGLAEAYKALLSACRSTAGELEIIASVQGEEYGKKTVGVPAALYEAPGLIRLLEVGKWSEAELKLDEIARQLEASPAETQEVLLEVYFHLSGAFAGIIHRTGRSLEEVMGADYRQWLMPAHFHTVKQLTEAARRVLARIRDNVIVEGKSRKQEIVEAVHRYAERKLESANLQSVADHIGLHPVYLSKMYKSETGENISEYLYRIRMEQAERLLADPRLRIYEIAERIGYNKPQYFIKLFKTYSGSTPQEYRDRVAQYGRSGEIKP